MAKLQQNLLKLPQWKTNGNSEVMYLKNSEVPLIAERALRRPRLFSVAITDYLTQDNLEREAVHFG